MGRGGQTRASSAEGLLYGQRRRGGGPQRVIGLRQLIEELSSNQLPAPLLDNQSALMIQNPIKSVTFAGEEASSLSLTGFHAPFQQAEAELMFSVGSNSISLKWSASGGATDAESSLLRGLAGCLDQARVTVFFYPQSERRVADYMNNYFPDAGAYPLGLVVDPEAPRQDPSVELDYLASESVEVDYFGDLIAASDLTDFMRYSRQPLITLQKAFSARSYALTLPLARFSA